MLGTTQPDTPSSSIHDLALHKVVDVLELLLSARQRLRDGRHMQPIRERKMMMKEKKWKIYTYILYTYFQNAKKNIWVTMNLTRKQSDSMKAAVM